VETGCLCWGKKGILHGILRSDALSHMILDALMTGSYRFEHILHSGKSEDPISFLRRVKRVGIVDVREAEPRTMTGESLYFTLLPLTLSRIAIPAV